MRSSLRRCPINGNAPSPAWWPASIRQREAVVPRRMRASAPPSIFTSPDASGAEPERLLLDAIADGELDHTLYAVADAVHARLALLQTVKAASALAQLNVGDVVRLNHKVRPRYLQGAQGKVVAVDERDATVRL